MIALSEVRKNIIKIRSLYVEFGNDKYEIFNLRKSVAEVPHFGTMSTLDMESEMLDSINSKNPELLKKNVLSRYYRNIM